MPTTFSAFVIWLQTPEGRAALGTACFLLTGFVIKQVAKRRPVKLDNDDKRLISLGMVLVVTVITHMLAIGAGYQEAGIEGWYTTLTTVAGVGIILFTGSRFLENRMVGNTSTSREAMRAAIAASKRDTAVLDEAENLPTP